MADTLLERNYSLPIFHGSYPVFVSGYDHLIRPGLERMVFDELKHLFAENFRCAALISTGAIGEFVVEVRTLLGPIATKKRLEWFNLKRIAKAVKSATCEEYPFKLKFTFVAYGEDSDDSS